MNLAVNKVLESLNEAGNDVGLRGTHGTRAFMQRDAHSSGTVHLGTRAFCQPTRGVMNYQQLGCAFIGSAITAVGYAQRELRTLRRVDRACVDRLRRSDKAFPVDKMR